MKSTKLLNTVPLLIVGVGLAVNGYSQSFLTNGLVAYYPFNGNANDASGNGINGTVYGATLTTDRFGNTNAAYYFDGVSAYITTPLGSSAFSNDFTASVWFNAYDIANAWPTLLQEQWVSFLLQIVGQSSNVSPPDRIGNFVSYDNYAPYTAGASGWYLDRFQQTPLNIYCQVVVTKAGTNVAMYLNSQIAATGQVTNPTTHPGSYLTIGSLDVAVFGPTEGLFHGVIDDIRIYNRALSSNEVAQLYAIESGPRMDLVKAVKPSFRNLTLTTNYQLQISGDLNTWTNYGGAFTATNTSMVYPQYFDVDNWNSLFFRVQSVP
jgi:hypothetical protein